MANTPLRVQTIEFVPLGTDEWLAWFYQRDKLVGSAVFGPTLMDVIVSIGGTTPLPRERFTVDANSSDLFKNFPNLSSRFRKEWQRE